MRVGEIEFEFSTVVVLTLIVFFTMGAGGFVSQLQDIINRGYANMDKVRIDNSLESLHGESSARVRLVLHNEYNFSVADYSNAITMDADFINQREGLAVQFTPWFTARMRAGNTEIRTDEVCLIKQGYYVTVTGPGGCEPRPCGQSSSLGVCSAFYPHAEAEEFTTRSGTTVTSSELHDFPENVPADGYVCKNGAFTQENFYTRHEKSCVSDTPSGPFIDINRVSCPNQVLLNKDFSCVVRTTLRCDAGGKINVTVNHQGLTEDPEDMVITAEEREDEAEDDDSTIFPTPDFILADSIDIIRRCSGQVQHERVPFTMSINDTTRRYNFEFTVSTPNGEQSRSDEAMRVLP